MDKSKKEIPLFPIASWKTGPVLVHGIIVFCPDFLEGPDQPPEQATPGRNYALTPVQARNLISDLHKALAKLEMYGSEGGSGASH